MRRNRFITTAAAIMILSACSQAQDEPSFNPTPRPTRPGQAVIIAGDPGLDRPPRDGEYALRASAYSDGGLAVDPRSGAVYFPTAGSEGRSIARIERDGRLTLIRSQNHADQLGISGNELWVLSSQGRPHLTSISLSTLQTTFDLDLSRIPERIQITNPSGDPLSDPERSRLEADLSGSSFTIRGDGIPVIASRAGRIFELSKTRELREWIPDGYAEALRQTTEGKEFRLMSLAPAERRGVIVLGRNGLVRVDDSGHSKAIRFPTSDGGRPPWSAALSLDDGSILLLGGTTETQRTPRPTLVRPDGSLELLSFGGPRWCDEFDGSLAVVASANPGGLAKRTDGTYVISDKDCGKVYSFTLPPRLSGSPYPR
ncbi:hypothetical protein ABZ801_10885 [Actinomadura sp. NPDC047616]|uniref:hypothetical protein n=1 Tax=Actinomadura sp. NPDC047616 TaxID=3155914 RepID=UPI0033D5DBCF